MECLSEVRHSSLPHHGDVLREFIINQDGYLSALGLPPLILLARE